MEYKVQKVSASEHACPAMLSLQDHTWLGVKNHECILGYHQNKKAVISVVLAHYSVLIIAKDSFPKIQSKLTV